MPFSAEKLHHKNYTLKMSKRRPCLAMSVNFFFQSYCSRKGVMFKKTKQTKQKKTREICVLKAKISNFLKALPGTSDQCLITQKNTVNRLNVCKPL